MVERGESAGPHTPTEPPLIAGLFIAGAPCLREGKGHLATKLPPPVLVLPLSRITCPRPTPATHSPSQLPTSTTTARNPPYKKEKDDDLVLSYKEQVTFRLRGMRGTDGTVGTVGTVRRRSGAAKMINPLIVGGTDPVCGTMEPHPLRGPSPSQREDWWG